MQNSLNNDGLYRVYFNNIDKHFILVHENLWLTIDDMPLYRKSFLDKLYAGTGDECVEFVKSQPSNPESCIVIE